ncbi:MAG: hypothetical protein H7A23_05865 [Leptospiraceae bacterium]|nr:hypothetical protein [Leptospiraceae bacterium]
MTVLLIIFIEVLLYGVRNLHYIDGGGAFLTTYKKLVAEDKNQEYDILMYGDSRSLSIKGNPRDEKHPLSFYNFSLPAAGPRYFKYYLKKYLLHHQNRPKVVVWAADPEQFMFSKSQTFDSDPELWSNYKHRLLNLFSLSESYEQYDGKESFFILKEYMPYTLKSIKHRQGFESIIMGFKFKYLLGKDLPNISRNVLIQTIIESTYGQINLGNYFFAPEILGKEELKNKLEQLQTARFSLEPLVEFSEYCEKERLKLVVLNLPRAEGLNETPYFKEITPVIKKVTKKFANSIYLEFPEMDYSNSLFAESIHYNSKGEIRVNRDFTEGIYPKILEFSKK